MDQAFDADVIEHPSLSADWVIEQRKAYAAALEALTSAIAASAAADLNAQENLDAADGALQRLVWLQAAINQIISLPRKSNHEPN